MSKPWTEDECGIGPFWRVRVVLPGSGLIHLASRTEPVVHYREGGKVGWVELELIEGTEHGDTIGFMDWSAVSALTWRKVAPTPKPEPEPEPLPAVEGETQRDRALRLYRAGNRPGSIAKAVGCHILTVNAWVRQEVKAGRMLWHPPNGSGALS